jgi:hypothetical protein
VDTTHDGEFMPALVVAINAEIAANALEGALANGNLDAALQKVLSAGVATKVLDALKTDTTSELYEKFKDATLTELGSVGSKIHGFVEATEVTNLIDNISAALSNKHSAVFQTDAGSGVKIHSTANPNIEKIQTMFNDTAIANIWGAESLSKVLGLTTDDAGKEFDTTLNDKTTSTVLADLSNIGGSALETKINALITAKKEYIDTLKELAKDPLATAVPSADKEANLALTAAILKQVHTTDPSDITEVKTAWEGFLVTDLEEMELSDAGSEAARRHGVLLSLASKLKGRASRTMVAELMVPINTIKNAYAGGQSLSTAISKIESNINEKINKFNLSTGTPGSGTTSSSTTSSSGGGSNTYNGLDETKVANLVQSKLDTAFGKWWSRPNSSSNALTETKQTQTPNSALPGGRTNTPASRTLEGKLIMMANYVSEGKILGKKAESSLDELMRRLGQAPKTAGNKKTMAQIMAIKAKNAENKNAKNQKNNMQQKPANPSAGGLNSQQARILDKLVTAYENGKKMNRNAQQFIVKAYIKNTDADIKTRMDAVFGPSLQAAADAALGQGGQKNAKTRSLASNKTNMTAEKQIEKVVSAINKIVQTYKGKDTPLSEKDAKIMANGLMFMRKKLSPESLKNLTGALGNNRMTQVKALINQHTKKKPGENKALAQG